MSFITSPGVIVPPLTAGGVAYGTGSQAKVTSAGTVGQFLQSNGAGVPVFADAGSQVVRVARTSNTVLVKANNGNLIDITSGTFSQTFTAAATLVSGWFCYIQNSGTGDITLDPNGSETIDSLTSYIMYPGECRLIQCTGTGFTSVVLVTFSRTFTTSGTFIKPPGYSIFCGLLWGGGGGGGKNNVFGNAYSGGGGACVPFTLPASLFGATETTTVATGGTGATVNGNDGNVGGNSSIGTVVSGFGGHVAGGGILTAANSTTPGQPYNTASTRANDGFGGSPPSSDPLNNCSVYGGAGGAGNNTIAANGGASVYGGGGGGVSGGAGGVSFYGGNGGLGGTTSTGTVGAAPGGGGGATDTGAAGGAGGRGEVRIWGII